MLIIDIFYSFHIFCKYNTPVIFLRLSITHINEKSYLSQQRQRFVQLSDSHTMNADWLEQCPRVLSSKSKNSWRKNKMIKMQLKKKTPQHYG